MLTLLQITEYAVNRVKFLTKNAVVNPVSARQYGENYFWFYERKQPKGGYRSCRDAVNMWYDGVKLYDFRVPGFSKHTGGFTQLVWRSSEQVGCAMVHDDEKDRDYYQTFIVCNYWPPGNVDMEYPYNVLPKKGQISSSHGSNNVEIELANSPGIGDLIANIIQNSNNRPDRPHRPVEGNHHVIGGNRPIGSGGNNDWDNERPGNSDNIWGSDRPGNRPIGGGAGSRPIGGGGNRPNDWDNQRPIGGGGNRPNDWENQRPIGGGGNRPNDWDNQRPIGGGGNRPNDWDNQRPGDIDNNSGGVRPGNRPIIGGGHHRPIHSGNQRPGGIENNLGGSRPGNGPIIGGGGHGNNNWGNQRPGNSDNTWGSERPGNRPIGSGPEPPNYPYPLLVPVI